MAPASASVLLKCVHLCLSVSHMSILSEAICSILSSVWIPESSQGQGWGTWAWEESRARVRAVGTPEPQVAGTWVPPISALP